jgi:hypothetical protein
MLVSEVPGAPDHAAPFKEAAPMAAAALAVVAAIVGGALLSAQPGPPPGPAMVTETSGTTAPSPGSNPELDQPRASTAATPIDPAAHPAPPGAPDPVERLATIQFDQVTPALPAQGIEIVVKFKDDKKVKDIVDAFWKDQPSARAKFEAFKQGRPEFADLKLDRVTYSNELVLVHQPSAPPAQRLAAMRDIALKLKNVADISYAEPNLTAQPGGQ